MGNITKENHEPADDSFPSPQDNCNSLVNGLLPVSPGGQPPTLKLSVGGSPDAFSITAPLIPQLKDLPQGAMTPNVLSPTRQTCPFGGLVFLTSNCSEAGLQLVSKCTLAVERMSCLSIQPRHAYCCGATLPLSGGASGPGVLAAAFLAARVARLLATAGDIEPDAHRAFV